MSSPEKKEIWHLALKIGHIAQKGTILVSVQWAWSGARASCQQETKARPLEAAIRPRHEWPHVDCEMDQCWRLGQAENITSTQSGTSSCSQGSSLCSRGTLANLYFFLSMLTCTFLPNTAPISKIIWIPHLYFFPSLNVLPDAGKCTTVFLWPNSSCTS